MRLTPSLLSFHWHNTSSLDLKCCWHTLGCCYSCRSSSLPHPTLLPENIMMQAFDNYYLLTSLSLLSIRMLHSGDRFRLVESQALKVYLLTWNNFLDCSILELVAGGGDGELDGVTVWEAVSTLGLVDAPHVSLELDHGPGVAAVQGGPGDPGQVPGDAVQVVGGYANIALQNTVAEGIILKQLQTLFIREHTFPLFWGNSFNRRISTEYLIMTIVYEGFIFKVTPTCDLM